MDFDELGRVLRERPRRSLRRQRAAAVLVPIVDDGGPLRLILTRRTEGLSTHKGQVAFPGGGIDPGDAGPTTAALREAEEEIGLKAEAVEVLGWLDDFPTIYGNTIVTPVIGRLRVLPPLRPSPDEVARIFTIPFEILERPTGWRVDVVRRRDRDWPMIYCDHDGETLWGLSAYITMHLLEFWPQGAPIAIPGELIQ